VKEVADQKGVKVIICKSPCIAVASPGELSVIDEKKCINCKKCITELGCPAIVLKDGIPFIEDSLCFGCDLCRNVCPTGAIGGVNHD
ncbi:MAG: 4Fe-4S binding protein, partial [Clostridiales bacterium]|nr:4Fe-4S binding protein [Clostridiales bacterium]